MASTFETIRALLDTKLKTLCANIANRKDFKMLETITDTFLEKISLKKEIKEMKTSERKMKRQYKI